MPKVKYDNNGEVIQFATAYAGNETQAVPAGEEIYEWEYYDDKGEIVKEKTNVYQKIQSFERSVDYKAQIEKGEQFDDTPLNYMDISELGNADVPIDTYLASLRAKIENDIAYYQKQSNKAIQVVAESRQTLDENKKEGEKE